MKTKHTHKSKEEKKTKTVTVADKEAIAQANIAAAKAAVNKYRKQRVQQ